MELEKWLVIKADRPQKVATEELPLLPELVVEDFIETAAIVGRFATHNSFFSLDQVETHLLGVGAQLPEAFNNWSSLFTDLQEEVIIQFAARSEKRNWTLEEMGAIVLFSLTEDKADTPVKIEEPITIEPVQSMHTEKTTEPISVEQPTKDSSAERKQKGRPSKAESRPISEQELQIAVDILDWLTAPNTHVSRGETIKSLERDLSNGLSKPAFRKILRTLQALQFVYISHTTKSSNIRKSPKVTLLGQDTKISWLKDRDSNIQTLEKATIRF